MPEVEGVEAAVTGRCDVVVEVDGEGREAATTEAAGGGTVEWMRFSIHACCSGENRVGGASVMLPDS